MRKLITIVLLAVSLSLLMTACGGSGGNAPSTSIKVTLGDFYDSPKTSTIPAGAVISITSHNNGVHIHYFTIMKKGITVEHWSDAEDKPNVYWSTGPIQAGQSFAGSFTAPSDPGEYQVVCEDDAHIEAGMIGKLIVVAP